MTDTPDPLRDHLHQMIAAVAQREYKNSITSHGTVAHADHLGSRIAAEIMKLFPAVYKEPCTVRSIDPDGVEFDATWFTLHTKPTVEVSS